MDMNALKAPFSPDEIDWRVGSTTGDKQKGMALAYLDARAVMDRLDAVCGPDGWQCRYPVAADKTCCEIGVRVNGEWVWKADGAGDTDFEGTKGAFSDAFKRAAVKWGVGRYLYDLKAPWVQIEAMGRSFKIKDSELPKLRALLPKAAQSSPDPTPEPVKKNPPGISKFREESRAFYRDLYACGDYDSYVAFVNSKESMAFLERAMREFPNDWHGDGGDVKGIKEDMRVFCEKLKQADGPSQFAA